MGERGREGREREGLEGEGEGEGERERDIYILPVLSTGQQAK